MLHPISASDLVCFTEIASTLNITRASERLGVTQPSLSQALARIETQLGVEVFVRHKRGVTLTPAGQQLLIGSRSLLQEWEKIRTRAQSSMHDRVGSFTIGCHPAVARYALAPFLKNILENESIEIHLQHDISRKITERVISSHIDIGIVVNPVRHPDLVLQKLYTDEVCFWALPEKRHSKTTSQKDLTIIYDPSMNQAQQLLLHLQKKNPNTRRFITSSNLDVIAELTSNGCGMGILPTRVARLSRNKLELIKDLPKFADTIYVVIRVESKSIAGIRYICDKIVEGSKC
jgi:LysR family transcriptional regulator, cell division regulator